MNKDQQHNKFPLERVIWDFYSDISDKKIFIHTFSHPDAFRKVFEAFLRSCPRTMLTDTLLQEHRESLTRFGGTIYAHSTNDGCRPCSILKNKEEKATKATKATTAKSSFAASHRHSKAAKKDGGKVSPKTAAARRKFNARFPEAETVIFVDHLRSSMQMND
ncbi:MAG TPA: hypothetical protein EYO58_12665 [Flavobacteriales bacterium]|nr:hypothetical protein [Flavobacteriales bacterium]